MKFSAVDATLPLEGLMLHLLHAGFALSVRDYGDALQALRLGYGVGERNRLLWLAKTLWARSDLDAVRIEGLFRQFARPTDNELRELIGDRDPTQPASAPEMPEDKPKWASPRREAADDAATPMPRIGFAAPDGGTGGLPRAQTVRPPSRSWVFEPRTTLTQRALSVAWRRYRRATRSGAKTELDVEATVAARCRHGVVAEPAFVAPRRNQARLLVFADASASMLPWRRLHPLLSASLASGRLAHSRLLAFDNDPRSGLFADAGLSGARIDLDAVISAEPGAAVLVVGDAGAARGRFDERRIAGTRDFIDRIARAASGIAWLNPMPAARWSSTSAGSIALASECPMFQFDADGLTRAVDTLRGARR